MFCWIFLFWSALLNFLDLSDRTFWCLCLVYVTHLAKTLQGCLIKNNSCSFWAEDFGLWNSLSGWRALWVPRTERLYSQWTCPLCLWFSTFLLHFKDWWKCFSFFACAQRLLTLHQRTQWRWLILLFSLAVLAKDCAMWSGQEKKWYDFYWCNANNN